MKRIKGLPIPDTTWLKSSYTKWTTTKNASASTLKSLTEASKAKQGPDKLLLAQNHMVRLNKELEQMKANYLKE